MLTRNGFVLLKGISADNDNRSREANDARSGARTRMRIADPEKLAVITMNSPPENELNRHSARPEITRQGRTY
jgi:hypothetical protein